MPALNGIILVDKPRGPTSRSALDSVQRAFGDKSLGHAGTLDPLASGLLVVLAGRARRLQDVLFDGEKTYIARVHLGYTTETLDAEAPEIPTGIEVPNLGDAERRGVLDGFIGTINQVPPSYSALRIDGRRAHKLARRGRVVEMEARPISIHAIREISFGDGVWEIEVRCGKGTYIRSLARDLGVALGCGGYLMGLRRTRIEPYAVEDAVSPALVTPDRLIPSNRVLARFARVDVDAEGAQRLRRGLAVPCDVPVPGTPPVFAWCADTPLCRLHQTEPGRARSDLLLEDPTPA